MNPICFAMSPPEAKAVRLPVKTSPLKGLKNHVVIPLRNMWMRYISSLQNRLCFSVPLLLWDTFFSFLYNESRS